MVQEIDCFCVVKGSEASGYFVHCFDVLTLKFCISINHIPYFIHAVIYSTLQLN